MGLQPRGYTVWVNGPNQCRIRICGLTEEQAKSLRKGCLDITLRPDRAQFYGKKLDMDCPACGSENFIVIEGSDCKSPSQDRILICKDCGYHEE